LYGFDSGHSSAMLLCNWHVKRYNKLQRTLLKHCKTLHM
jgi:hypothetical protein